MGLRCFWGKRRDNQKGHLLDSTSCPEPHEEMIGGKHPELQGRQRRVLGVHFGFHQMLESEQLPLLRVTEIPNRSLRAHL